MTENDRKALAAEIADQIKIPACPHGIDAETAASLIDFAKAYKDTKINLRRAIIWVVVPTIISAFGAGIVAIIKGYIKP